jgi:hypothetical protein
MRERGWPWHQQTVTKVEAGNQQLGFGEAADLAAVLDVTADQLTWLPAEAAEAAIIGRAAAILRQAWADAAETIAGLHRDIAAAQRTLAESQDSRLPRVREACAALREELRASTVESALAHARAAAAERGA